MTRLVELVRGIWIEGLDKEVGQEAEALCRVMESNITDAVLALLLLERASVASKQSAFNKEAWERDRELERQRREELEAEEPEVDGEWHGDRITRLHDRAKRHVIRAKWDAGELPGPYSHRLPFLHARTFMTSLAQLGRTMTEMAKLETGDAKALIVAATRPCAPAPGATRPAPSSSWMPG